MATTGNDAALRQLDELLADARTVALYGQRSSRIQGSALVSAIAAAEGLTERTWNAPEVTALQAALGRALIEITPTNLIELRDRNPFREKSFREKIGETTKKLVMAGFITILVAVVGYYTLLYNRGNHVLSELSKIDEALPDQRVSNLARVWNAIDFNHEGKGAYLDTYFGLVSEIQALNDRTEFYLQAARNFTREVRYLQRYFATDPAPLPLSAGATTPGSCFEAGPATINNLLLMGSSPGMAALAKDRALIEEFRCIKGLMIGSYTDKLVEPQIEDIRGILNLFGSWLLPALYGALGAAVFYMRSLLHPFLPDPTGSEIVHRISLGAFAGIIFAWFVSPSPANLNAFNGLTVNAFAVAFLIGFSLDVFFALLDRMVGFLKDVVSGDRLNQIAFAGTPFGLPSSNGEQPGQRKTEDKMAGLRDETAAANAAAQEAAAKARTTKSDADRQAAEAEEALKKG